MDLIEPLINENTDWLVAGLGNPGNKYAGTRHNIGWMAAEALCKKYKLDPRLHHPYCYLADIEISGVKVYIAFPLTFMNASGQAMSWLANRLGISPERTLIIVDEYNFPLGRLHLKRGGSDGGHNGTASVIDKLGSTDFWRLRCGISQNFPPGMLVEYVLSKFNKQEAALRDIMIENAVRSVEYIMKEGTARAMSEINSGRLFE